MNINKDNSSSSETAVDSLFWGRINGKLMIIDNHGAMLEVGSFKDKSNAFAYRKVLEKLSGKSVVIVYNDMYYSVRIPGFETNKMALKLASKITELGQEPPYISRERRNTSYLQLGEFLKEAQALTYRDELKGYTNRKVWVIYENNRYKVIMPGFRNHRAAVDLCGANKRQISDDVKALANEISRMAAFENYNLFDK